MPAPTLGGLNPLTTDWAQVLLALPQGWDSYDASPICSIALETLGKFAIVPLSSGGVQLEVHRNGYDIEIEIGSDGAIKGALIGHDT